MSFSLRKQNPDGGKGDKYRGGSIPQERYDAIFRKDKPQEKKEQKPKI